MRVSCWLGSRCFSSSTTRTSSALLSQLLRNKELDIDDARNELRWMRQFLKSDDGLADLVERRSQGEPLQYILGSADFGPLTLKCRAPTLIPRPETAHVFTRLADLLRQTNGTRALSIMDLCTGSAPIPLLLTHELGDLVRCTGYELSEQAIQLAKENIESTNLDVDVQQADILASDFASKALKEGRVDIIVSNPPYIPQSEYDLLPPSVKEWEDEAALLGENGGLLFYERVAELLPRLLTSRQELGAAGWMDIPRVAVEIGHQQGLDVSRIFKNGGMSRTEVWQDQFGTDRMVLGWDR